uniref:Uncharacterized protein n=1 Tax=Anguilla anguilla TaxID=7936 RepID=A0A0E9PRF1_ANGAN
MGALVGSFSSPPKASERSKPCALAPIARLANNKIHKFNITVVDLYKDKEAISRTR